MIVGSLFSGCGGIDRGLELAGHEIAWACESDRYCRSVIERHWPGLEIYRDVRELDAGTPRVEILAGGFPCQDLSQAGERAGLAGERSGLWFAFADAIRLLRPGYVLIENVPGLATARGARTGESALGTVIADLAEAGYVGSLFRVSAADVGAPHLRERIFIVARASPGSWTATSDAGRSRGWKIATSASTDEGESSGRSSDANHEPERAGTSRFRAAERTTTADPRSKRLDRGRGGDTGDQTNERSHRGTVAPGSSASSTEDADRWGIYRPAIERWQQILGRRAPEPTDAAGRLTPELVEWMLGFPDQWTAGSSRTQRLKMLGNACQVQVAELIGSQLEP